MPKTNREFHFSKQAILDKPLPEKKIWYRDKGKKGLSLEVTTNANYTFWFKKTHMGKRQDRKLGVFPALGVKEARQQVDVYLGELAKEASIISLAPTVRGSKSLDDFFDYWIEEYAKAHRPGTWQHDKGLYKNHIKDDLGNLKLPIIRVDQVRKLHGKIGRKISDKTGKPTHRQANAMLQLISTMFNRAKEWKMYVGENPTIGIQKFKEKSIIRFLSKDEYSRLEDSLLHKDTPVHMRQVVFLALFTGQRSAAIMSMKWRDVDLTDLTWTVTAEDSKNDDPVSVPLHETAVQILVGMKKASKPEDKWVFPSTRGDGHRIMQHKFWKPVLKRAGITEFRFHDLRHTFASWQAMNGTSLNIIKDACGHRSIQTTIKYAHLNNDAVRKATGAAFSEMTGGSKTKKRKKKGGK